MTTKEELLQEIEQTPEPLLVELLVFLRSRKSASSDPVEAYLDELIAKGDYADDVSPEELAASEAAYQDHLEGKDAGISLEELKRQLQGQQGE